MVTASQTRHAAAAAKARHITPSPAPGTIERSDRHAQRLWRTTRANAIKTYGDDALARRLAFSALKGEYERRGDRWVRKEAQATPPARAVRKTAARPAAKAAPARAH
nr:ChaB family protein [Gammaproteobacteria bacterium]